MPPTFPKPQDFDDEPRHSRPDHQDQQREHVEDHVGNELPGGDVAERRYDDIDGDEPADQDRCPLRQLVAPAHGQGTGQALAWRGRAQDWWCEVQGGPWPAQLATATTAAVALD